MTNNLPDVVFHYLVKYSYNTWSIESNLCYKIENAVIVPVICEYENVRALLSSLLRNHSKYLSNTIIIFVVSGFIDSNKEVKFDNEKTLCFLREIISHKNSSDSLITEIKNSQINIGLIDVCSPGLEMPFKIGGVGLARKVGMDIALKIFDYDSAKQKILICLDADCIVEQNYLMSIIEAFNTKNLSAAYVNFQHRVEEIPNNSNAIICYEIFLHYYVLGLKYANSPFAFHTVGSTMVCNYESYIKVEGMNKRKAAEDFYFMEKLAKNYRIEKINSTTVYPSSRVSWRVPFGTGQRVGRFLSEKQNEYLLYNPFCFDILKQWLEIFSASEAYTSDKYIQLATKINPELSNFLLKQNFVNDWNKILDNSTTSKQISKQKQKWFDGFRTLKLIHHLRDTAFPQINMFEALNGMFERIGVKNDLFWYEKSVPNLEVQRRYLELLRELT